VEEEATVLVRLKMSCAACGDLTGVVLPLATRSRPSVVVVVAGCCRWRETKLFPTVDCS
jgi:hypothetical protein